MLDDGLLVYAKPISMYDTVSLVGEACLDEGILNGNWSLMEAFTDGNFGVLLEKFANSEASELMDEFINELPDDLKTTNIINALHNKISDMYMDEKTYSKATIAYELRKLLRSNEFLQGLPSDQANMIQRFSNAARSNKDLAQSSAFNNPNQKPMKRNSKAFKKIIDANNPQSTTQSDTSTTSTVPSETGGQKPADTSQLEEKVKELEYKGMNAPRRYISKAIAWLHRKAAEYNNKIHNKGMKDGSIKWYQKILSYITRAIESLTRRLHNFVSDDKNQLKEYDRTWDFKKK